VKLFLVIYKMATAQAVAIFMKFSSRFACMLPILQKITKTR